MKRRKNMKNKILCIMVCMIILTVGVCLASGSKTTQRDDTVELSIRGGLGKCEFTVTNNGTEAVLAYASVAVGGILKSNDQVGFPVPANGETITSIYKVRAFAPIEASLVVDDQVITRSGFIIGIFVLFTQ